MEIEQYVGKRVEIIDSDGKVWTGDVVGFIRAVDNEPEIDEIDLKVNGERVLYSFSEADISEIKVIN